tara:strand:- start:420 stop:644 length:225 start_codon:yes stop_codon:yes gene_type:complete
MLEWLQSVVPDEEKDKVTLTNLENYLPDQTHIYANRHLRVSAYTLRWFIKGIKKIIKATGKEITEIQVQELEGG